MKRFKKLVFYDLKKGAIEKGFINKLKRFASSVKIVLANEEYDGTLKPADLHGADALVERIFDHYDDEMWKNSELKYLGAMHTDVSHYNAAVLKKKGIVLTNVPGYSTEAVAELTISALLNTSRQTHDAMNFVKKGNWGFEKFLGWELKGKTLGIIGMGRIGERVGEIAQALGMKVIYFSRTKEKVQFEFVSLNRLLKESDVVSLHCSLTSKTRNILNKNRLKTMKNGAVLLDAGRMELVDLKTLHSMCISGKISAAWFDELQDKNWRKKFSKLNNVYLTPDYGWMTKEAQQKTREITLGNIEAFLKGKPINVKN